MKKSLLIVAAMAFVCVNAFATTTTTTTATKKAVGHDKEHTHIEGTPDHAHDDAHHGAHDHKAHHPEHVETSTTDTKKVETKKK